MTSLIANMSTFPPRQDTLETSLGSIAGQVDQLNLVLNEYEEIPKFLTRYPTVNPIIPDVDLKDTGKFFPEVEPEDYVFLVDDDISYSQAYASRLLDVLTSFDDEKITVGLHGTIYARPTKSLRDRQRFDFRSALRTNTFVDQLGTGTVLLRGKNLPDFEFMLTSQQFVDVRFASWCFKNNISMLAIARRKSLAKQIKTMHGSIYSSFTRKSPENVLSEVRGFAGQNPKIKSRRNFRQILKSFTESTRKY